MMEEKLNELNIFALRDFARKTGVKSPTSKKKEQLIQEILEITSGAKKPEAVKNKQGRPPKVFDYNFSQVFNNFGEVNLSMQTLNQNVQQGEETEMTTVAGWLELLNNNAAMLWVEKDLKIEKYFVPNEVLKNYHVKMGDRIVAEVKPGEAQKVVKEIFSINDNPIMKLPAKRIEYSSVEHNLSNRELNFTTEEFSSLHLKYGENTYVYGENNNQNTMKAIELLLDCKISNKMYVNVALAEKNKIYMSNLKYIENFVSNLTDDYSVSSMMVYLAVERAKRILENGEDVLIVVDDIVSILGIEKAGLELVKNLISTTKEGGKTGSITIVAVIPNQGINQIEKLADKRLKIENGEIVVL